MSTELSILQPQPACTRCDLHAGGIKNPGVPWRLFNHHHGNDNVIIIIGMNPGFHEDVANSCWMGRSGKVMTESYIRGSRIDDHATIYLGNVARCYTPSGKPPTSRQYRACWMEHGQVDLLSILRKHDKAAVRAVLCAGADPLAHVTRWTTGKSLKQSDAFMQQGKEYAKDGVSFALFSTFHPSAVLRDPDKIHAVNDHMAIVRAHLSGTIPTSAKPVIVPAAFSF